MTQNIYEVLHSRRDYVILWWSGISCTPIVKLSIASELPVRRRYLRALIREQVEITMIYEITRIYDIYEDYFDDYVTMIITSTTTMMS